MSRTTMTMLPDKRISVHADPITDEALVIQARNLATQLGLNYSTPSLMMLTLTPGNAPAPGSSETKSDSALKNAHGKLELRLRDDRGKPVSCDLTKLDTSSSAGRSLKQPLVKALGIKRRCDPPLRVIDATAGWGEDTWLMLAQGCHVHAMERNPVMAVLLIDALRRALPEYDSLSDHVTVQAGCAIQQLAIWSTTHPQGSPWSEIDVVYLDPMFPPGRKTAPRKPMRVLHDLVGNDTDATDLIAPALQVATRRVVVKRPPKAPPLLANPVVSHHGKGVRYDVYVPGISKIPSNA
ncbi:MAG: class I SAM-dependent methyltransferase [Phycisphaeraceae bacterium]|nr:class I SAM-dependent methyltransferase [Phycisphaeraceae bacterium]